MQLLTMSMRAVRTTIVEWEQKRKLRRLLRRIRSIRQLEKGIGADRLATERLLLAASARRSGRMDATSALMAGCGCLGA
jgi:hypothetical protein